MTLNFPGPYQLRFHYTTANSSFAAKGHTQKLNINLSPDPAPGTPFSGITALNGVGGTQALNALVDAYLNLVKAIYANAANNTWDYVELWKYDPGTFDASFVSVYNTAVAGTSASPMNTANEQIMTFRTLEGGVMRVHYEESVKSIGVADSAPFADAALEAIRAYIGDTPKPFLGADTSYPFATIALYPGQNEALFKNRFRTA
jgi:hypothetical protein